jgi:hypothetical protein
MFFITQSDERPDGYVHLSTANAWTVWLSRNIPVGLHADVRHRLNSNLKHLLVGLELKAALIDPHAHRAHNQPSPCCSSHTSKISSWNSAWPRFRC